MAPGKAECLDEGVIAAFVAGALDPALLPHVETHLASCGACRGAAAAGLAYGETPPLGSMRTSSGATDTATNVLAGRFELRGLLARGGMGAVYRGHDRDTGETVAVKLIKPELLAEQPDLVARFVREGEVLRRLDHPNIVNLIAALTHEGQQYLVMEYVAGGSLRGLLREVPRLPLSRALPIALELADALARAHHLNILHRDIKPENVLLASDGTPRLTDFGLARSGDQRLTEENVILGTVAYLSPEALWGQPLDERADIWAFGVMLFEMLAGQHPFDGDRQAALITNILQREPPDLEALCPEVPMALIDLTYRTLEKDRRSRIPSARHVGAELEAIVKGFDQSPRRPAKGRSRAAPTPSPSIPLNNLPYPSTTLVGRDQELAELGRKLTDPAIRLLTILGPGGIGKTHLALELGRAVAVKRDPSFAPLAMHGVCFVSLAPIQLPELVIPTIGEAIGLCIFNPGDLTAQLLDYLVDKSMLLLLDNFEHLVGAAGTVSEILRRAPGVKVVVTSRERLHLEGENLFRVEGLSLPAPGGAVSAAECGAFQLFLECARRSLPGFTLESVADVVALARICRQVQGMPLGILLAAAWVGSLQLEEIAHEIERNLDFLETEQRDLPSRQRSLRAAFDHSFQLLSSSEQEVFQRLSVFRGGFTREAAEAVAAGSLRILASLVNKSMLVRAPSGRYDVHELLRQYAAAKLEQTSEHDATLDRYCQYFGTWITAQAKACTSPNKLRALTAIDSDLDNLFAAQEHALRPGKLDLLEPLLEGEFVYGCHRAPAKGEVPLLRCINTLRQRSLNPRERELFIRLLAKQGMVLGMTREPAEAQSIFDELDGLLHAGVTEDRTWVMATIWRGALLPWINQPMGKGPAELVELHRRVAGLLRPGHDEWLLAFNECILSTAELRRGAFEMAREHAQRAQRRLARLGDRRELMPRRALGFIALGESDLAGAQAHFEAVLLEAKELGERLQIPLSHLDLSRVHLLRGDHAEARRYAEEGRALFERQRHPLQEVANTLLREIAQQERAEGDRPS